MTKQFRLLLLDANIVIYLFKLGIWDRVVELCEVHLARTIVEREAHFYNDDKGQRHDFSLDEYVQQNKITMFDVPLSELKAFRDSFDLEYFEKLDPGETESLAFLLSSDIECKIASADKIVYRVLGNIDRGDQGISLEEILQQIGLGRSLHHSFSKDYRDRWTSKGFEERMQGIGKK